MTWDCVLSIKLLTAHRPRPSILIPKRLQNLQGHIHDHLLHDIVAGSGAELKQMEESSWSSGNQRESEGSSRGRSRFVWREKVKHVINVLRDSCPYKEDVMKEFAPQRDNGNLEQGMKLATMYKNILHVPWWSSSLEFRLTDQETIHC